MVLLVDSSSHPVIREGWLHQGGGGGGGVQGSKLVSVWRRVLKSPIRPCATCPTLLVLHVRTSVIRHEPRGSDQPPNLRRSVRNWPALRPPAGGNLHLADVPPRCAQMRTLALLSLHGDVRPRVKCLPKKKTKRSKSSCYRANR